MPDSVRAYVEVALDSLQANALHRDTITWRVVRDNTMQRAAGATSFAQTHDALEWAVHRADRHGLLIRATNPSQVSAPTSPRPASVRPRLEGRLLDRRVGYLRVPMWPGPMLPLADSLQALIAVQAAEGACGWVLDLRGNSGGNMWPMLAGIGPLLGDTIVGQFIGPTGRTRWWYRDGGVGLVQPDGAFIRIGHVARNFVTLDRFPPVAVITDTGTASSGEAIAVALSGRPLTRRFGTGTFGYTTSNRGIVLSDGTQLVVTEAVFADRTSRAFNGPLIPDEHMAPARPFAPHSATEADWGNATDHIVTRASAWLADQPGCRGP